MSIVSFIYSAKRFVLFILVILCLTVMTALAPAGYPRGTPEDGVKPLVSLMVWDGQAIEDLISSEFMVYQSGRMIPGLNVKCETGGTAWNGFNYCIPEEIDLRGSQASIKIRPVEEMKHSGNKSLTLTLVPDPSNEIDPDNAVKSIIIEDAEITGVLFMKPCSGFPELFPGTVEIPLSKKCSEDIRVDYTISGILVKNRAGECLSGAVMKRRCKLKFNFL